MKQTAKVMVPGTPAVAHRFVQCASCPRIPPNHHRGLAGSEHPAIRSVPSLAEPCAARFLPARRGADIAAASAFCHKPPRVEPPGRLGLPWRLVLLHQKHQRANLIRPSRAGPRVFRATESQMPKLKTKSGAKKRFKITGTGKVMYAQAGKRHGMIKRTTKQIRNLRGTTTLFEGDAANVKKYFLPNAR
jgi:large subunit ribosomal protein L35